MFSLYYLFISIHIIFNKTSKICPLSLISCGLVVIHYLYDYISYMLHVLEQKKSLLLFQLDF